jgi:glycosyltransferase involved in cell wall biosynthesis
MNEGMPKLYDAQMPTPLVSVLIRSIARETLDETLASIAKQDHPDIEVWVIAAVPGHPPIATTHGALSIRLVTTETPLPRSQAANKALELAQGEYVLIVDDDDWIAPNHISTLVKALQEAPAHAAAYSQTQTVTASGESTDMPAMGLPFDPLRLLSGNWMALHSVLFSIRLRDLGCRFDEQLNLYEDWDFWLQAAEHTSFLFVPVTTAFYRTHESSGVHLHAAFYGEPAQIIYDKWRNRWTPAQMGQVMERNWQHGDLNQMLKTTQAEVEQLHVSLNQLSAQRDQLSAYRSKLAQELVDLKNTTIPVVQHEHELNQLLHSRSWRITAPIRQTAHAVRRLREQSHTWLRLLRKALSSITRAPQLWRQHGWRGLRSRVQRELNQGSAYLDWIRTNEPGVERFSDLAKQVQNWQHKPLVSVLMPTYNSPLNYLKEAVESVQSQVYPHWELCIADDASTLPEVRVYLQQLASEDARIVLSLREKNGHISESSNTALNSARGEWVALLDHDDRLHPLALFCVVGALQDHPDAQIIYSDEDKIDATGRRFDPYFKGDYNRELMWAQNMISHLGCYKKRALTEIGGFRKGLEGSQDYDLALRVIAQCQPEQIIHIPRVLYHWRAIIGSTALSPDQKPYADSASRRALTEHLSHIGLAADVSSAPEIPNMNRVRPKLPESLPLVSILIPTRDRIELLQTCIESIQQRSTYPHIEIIVIDNGSIEPASLAYFEALQKQGIRIVHDLRPFNFSALNNLAAQHAHGEFLCLMNNDIEVVTPDWVEEMLSFAALPGAGAVGARLWYPHGQGLQHGGVVVGLGGVAGHAHVGLPQGQVGYFGRMALHHRLLAVTAACLFIRKSNYLAVGGMDEKIAVAFNDVDFCLRLHQAGMACVYTPYAEMIHHESASRGNDLSDAQRDRFMSEERFMHNRWGRTLNGDPFFSPNLSLQHTDFKLAEKSRLNAL